MTTIAIISIMSLLSLLFSGITVWFSIHAYCKVVGMEHSTHQVQYMPMEEYKSFQEAVNDNDDHYPDKMGMPITDPEEKEKKRQDALLEGFEQMYQQED